MKTNRSLILQQLPLHALIVAGACALAAVDANAQDTRSNDARVPDAATPDGEPLGPEIRREGDIAYVSGGIADGGKAKTIALGSGMNLELVFAQMPGGNYLADVRVAIADRSGNTVLELDSSDPLLFAQLQPGTYEVTATVDGRTIRRSVEVPSQGRLTEYIHWPDSQPARR